jgi:hypothetical protein
MRTLMALATIAGMTLAGAAAHAGRVPGALQPPHRDSVQAGDTDVYVWTFRGGEEAVILVRGDHDTDLDLYVYDQNGNLIAEDVDGSDTCKVAFTPLFTGRFTVKLVNHGAVYNEYTIETN